MADFEISALIMCDDVRKEISGKDIIIGAYSGEIVVPQLPVHVPLAFWIELTCKKTGRIEIELRVEVPGGQTPLQMVIGADVTVANETFSLATPQIGYPILKEGPIRISVRPVGHEKWRQIKRKNVRYASPPTQDA